MKVLVTGATGFIGSHLVKILVQSGHNVSVYSSSAFPGKTTPVGRDHWITGDLSTLPPLMEATENIDVVFHTSGLAHSGTTQLRDALKANTLSCENLYQASSARGVDKFVYISSLLASDPDDSPYAYSKSRAEEFLRSQTVDDGGTKAIILRPANVYGRDMKGGITTFIRMAKKGFLPSLPKTEHTFPLVSVDDLCRVAISLAEAKNQMMEPETYIVTDGEEYTLDRIEKCVYNCLETSTPSWRLPRVAFYLGAHFAQIANDMGLWKNHFGLRLYDKLFRGYLNSDPDYPDRYPLAGAASLESEMPKILKSIE